MSEESANKSKDDLENVAGGQVPRGVAGSEPGGESQDQDPQTPGDALDVEQLGGAAAGAAETPRIRIKIEDADLNSPDAVE